MQKDTSPFVSWLCREIKNKRLSVRQLGMESGIHASTITRWILGATEPDPRSVDMLAKYFQVDKAMLLRLLGRLEAASRIDLTEEEADFLRLYRSLSKTERARLRRAVAVVRDEPTPDKT